MVLFHLRYLKRLYKSVISTSYRPSSQLRSYTQAYVAMAWRYISISPYATYILSSNVPTTLIAKLSFVILLFVSLFFLVGRRGIFVAHRPKPPTQALHPSLFAIKSPLTSHEEDPPLFTLRQIEHLHRLCVPNALTDVVSYQALHRAISEMLLASPLRSGSLSGYQLIFCAPLATQRGVLPFLSPTDQEATRTGVRR